MIADEAYACRYGTFLGNCDKERQQQVRPVSFSAWTHIVSHFEGQQDDVDSNASALYRNQFYCGGKNGARNEAGQPVSSLGVSDDCLTVSTATRHLALWSTYHLRDTPAPATANVQILAEAQRRASDNAELKRRLAEMESKLAQMELLQSTSASDID